MSSAHQIRLFILFLLLLFFIILVRNAWVSDDAYITWRTLDNFVNTHRLTWNISERVQAYTHPLWMIILLIAYYATRETYLTTILISMGLSLAAMALVLKATSSKGLSLLVGFAILISSKAFIDFSSSGLENPATHFLVALLLVILMTKMPDDFRGRRAFLIGLLCALLGLNRLDLLLLIIPLIAYLLIQAFARREYRFAIILSVSFLIPLLGWEVFSVWYYGFPFPNTAYAKLNTQISTSSSMAQGALYFLNSLSWDPLTLLVITFGVIVAFLGPNRLQKMLGLGVVLYLGYILYIGGDFMSGRFFSAPLLICAIIIGRFSDSYLNDIHKSAIIITCLLLGFLSITPTLLNTYSYPEHIRDQNLVEDERSVYYRSTGLLWFRRTEPWLIHRWMQEGYEASKNGPQVIVKDSIGFFGFGAGRNIHIVDELALADPLLARLPVEDPIYWRIGHFRRKIPDGYIETLRTGTNQISNKSLSIYYDKLKLITSGSLWDKERLITIIRFNLGFYDHYLDDYVQTLQ